MEIGYSCLLRLMILRAVDSFSDMSVSGEFACANPNGLMDKNFGAIQAFYLE